MLQRSGGALSGARRPDKPLVPTKPFTLLPNKLFANDEEWETLDRGRWRWPDHVTLGEGRVVIKLLDYIAKIPQWHRSKVICLEDNAPTSGAFGKGRSTSVPVNYLCRRKAARSLAAEVRLHLPWVESSKQPADEASRIMQ